MSAFLYKKADRRILANSSRSESMLGKGATGVGINGSPRESLEYWEVERVFEERLVTRFSGGVLNRRKQRSFLILEVPHIEICPYAHMSCPLQCGAPAITRQSID